MPSSIDIATLVVGSELGVEFTVDREKWQKFLAAAEVIGSPPGTLLGESADLCMDTAIALATQMKSDEV